MLNSPAKKILDSDWFRHHLIREILPKWLGSVTDGGLFLPHFDRQWRPLGKNFGTLVSQSRLLYNFSKGYELTGDESYRRAVEAGGHFLLENFYDYKYGGWFWSCDLSGAALDICKDSYGHAFLIFGLAHACRCTGNEEYKTAALDAWQVLSTRFRDEHGGYSWRMTRDFQPIEIIKSQNPIMHLFEALLALSDVESMSSMRREAAGLADFVLTKLVRPADKRLPELYMPDWKELPEGPISAGRVSGGMLDIGHAFEWSYLLSTAVERGLPAEYLEQASSFIDYGLRFGYDAQAGGIYSPASYEGKPLSRRKTWWEQCEAVRALLHFVSVRKRADLWQPLEKTMDFIRQHFIDPEYGGWYMAAGPGTDPGDQQKGTEWKVDYHVVGMCMEAIRWENAEAGSL